MPEVMTNEVTLAIPAEQVARFRAAIQSELGADGDDFPSTVFGRSDIERSLAKIDRHRAALEQIGWEGDQVVDKELTTDRPYAIAAVERALYSLSGRISEAVGEYRRDHDSPVACPDVAEAGKALGWFANLLESLQPDCAA